MNIPSKFRPTGSGGLPPGYMRVDFLESKGAQWIDTGLLFAAGNIKTRTSSITHTTQNTVTGLLPYEYFGENDVDKGKVFAAYQETATIFSVDVTGISSRYFYNNVPNVANLIIDTENGFVELNGTRRSCTPITFEQTAVTLLIFAKKVWYRKTDLRVQPAKTGVRIHSFEVEAKANGNVQYGNFIPALDPTGTPCMFDTMSKQPFRNAGRGQFIVGMTLQQVRRLRLPAPTILNELTLSLPWEAEFDELAQAALQAAADKGWLLTLQYAPIDLPEFAGYARADYLETTGYQWLQLTDLHLGSTSDVNIKFAPTDMTTWFNLFYCLTDASYNRIGSIQHSKKIRYDYINQGNVYSSSELTVGSIYHVRKCGERNFLNGIEQVSNKSSECYINAPTLIGKAAHSSTLSHMRIFWFKAAANINVYAIPAISSDGTPCMFDLVSKTPYYDAGTSGVPFTVGLKKAQAETLVLGEKASGLTIAVPADTDLTIVEANNPGITIIIQTN